MEPTELNYEAIYYLSRQGSYGDWKVVQDEPLVVHNFIWNHWYELGDNNKVTQVFPTEITKIVYLPKELC